MSSTLLDILSERLQPAPRTQGAKRDAEQRVSSEETQRHDCALVTRGGFHSISMPHPRLPPLRSSTPARTRSAITPGDEEIESTGEGGCVCGRRSGGVGGGLTRPSCDKQVDDRVEGISCGAGNTLTAHNS